MKIDYYKITSKDIIDNFDDVFQSQEGHFPGIPTIAKSILIKKAYGPKQKVVLRGSRRR